MQESSQLLKAGREQVFSFLAKACFACYWTHEVLAVVKQVLPQMRRDMRKTLTAIVWSPLPPDIMDQVIAFVLPQELLGFLQVSHQVRAGIMQKRESKAEPFTRPTSCSAPSGDPVKCRKAQKKGSPQAEEAADQGDAPARRVAVAEFFEPRELKRNRRRRIRVRGREPRHVRAS